MSPVMLPATEADRLRALYSYEVLDTLCEDTFDSLARLAAHITGCPTAFISFVDADRQWFKSRYGFDTEETVRGSSFCAHAITTPGIPLVVPDATLDPRFADNALVTGPPAVRFYAGVPLVNPEGFALGTVCVLDYTARDISPEALDALQILAQAVMTALELRRALSGVRAMALSDDLTGLPNRSAFAAALAKATARQRRDGQPFTVLCLDLDNFKPINDRFGHVTGDAALVLTAGVLRSCIRAEDTPARLGGDEFGVVLVGGEAKAAHLVAERIRASIASVMADRGWDVTASVGAVTFIDPPRDEATAMKVADVYMYAAKTTGKNRIKFHDHITLRQSGPAPKGAPAAMVEGSQDPKPREAGGCQGGAFDHGSNPVLACALAEGSLNDVLDMAGRDGKNADVADDEVVLVDNRAVGERDAGATVGDVAPALEWKVLGGDFVGIAVEAGENGAVGTQGFCSGRHEATP